MDAPATVLDVITLEQLRALRELGFVIVHSVPTERMTKAAVRNQWPEERGVDEAWHRMVGESIRIQREVIAPTLIRLPLNNGRSVEVSPAGVVHRMWDAQGKETAERLTDAEAGELRAYFRLRTPSAGS